MRDLMAAQKPVRILDAGCGSSYLTFVVAWRFVHRWQHPVQILGIDRNAAVIHKCRRRDTARIGLEDVLRFEAAELHVAERCWRFGAKPSGPVHAAGRGAGAPRLRHGDGRCARLGRGARRRAGSQPRRAAQAELAARAGRACNRVTRAFAPIWSSRRTCRRENGGDGHRRDAHLCCSGRAATKNDGDGVYRAVRAHAEEHVAQGASWRR